MEAAPRLPMVSFPCRESPERADFKEVLKKYILYHYNEDPESYNNEINELEFLRSAAVNAQKDFMGCTTLKKYYCQLQYLTSRFPLDEIGIKLSFTWKSAFDQGSVSTGDMGYEMDSVLYNIATFHCSLGVLDSRATSDGMKISCTHFQCAAWAFNTLSQNPHSEGEINSHLMAFMQNVCLSQAQECILEKSLIDNRKPNIIAKVAIQVVEYLKMSLKNLESMKKSNPISTEIIGQKILKEWTAHCDFKIAYFTATSLYHQGLVSEEQQKMGERIAYYQLAVEKLDDASKFAKMLKFKYLSESLTFVNDVIRGKLKAAENENKLVYNEKIPPTSSLVEVKGAALVKCIPFSFTDEEVAGPDIFGRLVPLEAHQASSLYSEEKAKLLRKIAGQIQEKNEELEMYLASMQLDSFALEEDWDALPQEIVDACADLNSRDASRVLTAIMNEINALYHDIESKINETGTMIVGEEEKEKEFCLIMGTKPAPNQLLTEQKRELTKYKEAHGAALSNNQALHSAITQHKANISTLSKPLDALVECLPSVAGVENSNDKATRMEVQRLMSKIQEMQTQRRDFEDQFRQDIQKDDVTKLLVTNQDDMDQFFQEQLDKHKNIIALLEQNMVAQGNILQALSESNAAYASTRKVINQVKYQRTEVISALLSSYNAFLGVLEKAEDAHKFYAKLESQINKLHSRVKSSCKVRDEERDGKLRANAKRMGNLQFSNYGKPGSAPVMDPVSSGPKLKDFLQAGSSLKGLPRMPMNNTPSVPPGYNDIPSSTGMIPSSQSTSGSYPAVGSQPNNYGSYPHSQYAPNSQNIPSAPPSGAYPVTGVSNYQSYIPPNVSQSTTPNVAPLSNPNMPLTSNNYSSSVSSLTVSSNSTVQYNTVGNYGPSNVSYQSYSQNLPQSSQSMPSVGVQNNLNQYPQKQNVTGTVGGHSTPHVSQPGPNVTNFGHKSNTYGQSYGYPQTSTGNTAYPGYQNPSVGVSYQNYPNAPNHLNQAITTNGNPSTYPPSTVNTYKGTINSQVPSTASSYNNSNAHYFSGQQSQSLNHSSQYNAAPQMHMQNAAHQRPGQNAVPQMPGQTAVHQMPGQTAVPQMPAQTAVPQIPGQTAVSQRPGQNVISQIPGQTAVYQMPGQAAVPQMPGQTAVPQMHGQNAVPQMSGQTAVPQMPGQTAVPQMPGQTAVPQMSGQNAVPQMPRQHTIPQVTNPNAISQAPAHNSVPQIPARNTLPQIPNQNTMPQSSAQSGIPQMPTQNTALVNPSLVNSSGYYVPRPTVPMQSNTGTPRPQNTVGYYNQYGYQYPPSTYQSQQPPIPNSQNSYPNYPSNPNRMPGHNATSIPQNQVPPSSKADVKSTPVAPSNVDLLSGIDVTISSASQWSPLTPQSVSDDVPDASTTATQVQPPNVATSAISTNNAVDKGKENISLPNDGKSDSSTFSSSSAILDLAKLAKSRTPVSVLDPLSNDETLTALVAEVERFSKFVQSLDKTSLNGQSHLEIKWNEFTELLERNCGGQKVSIGRCYPLKNRFPDNLPFDSTRVTLPSTRDDYINASHVQLNCKEEETIPMIITQAPMSNTILDFWTMIWEGQVELIVCLNTDLEVKGQTYIPASDSENFEIGNFSVTLKQLKSAPSQAWVQRTLQITQNVSKSTRVVIHLQFLMWPPGVMPESANHFLQFVGEFHSQQKQLRNKAKPVAVHCVSGTGRSGVLAVLSAFIKQVNKYGVMPEIWNLMLSLCEQRRAALQDRGHILFLYSAALYYVQDVLMKRGILTDKATFSENPKEKTHVRHPSADLLSADLHRMKAKLGLGEDPSGLSRSNSQSSMISIASSSESQCNLGSAQGAQTQVDPSHVNPSPTHGSKIGSAVVPPSLAASLDPNRLTLSPPQQNQTKKITKESFSDPNSSGLLSQTDAADDCDPLNELDPLWTLKKS